MQITNRVITADAIGKKTVALIEDYSSDWLVSNTFKRKFTK